MGAEELQLKIDTPRKKAQIWCHTEGANIYHEAMGQNTGEKELARSLLDHCIKYLLLYFDRDEINNSLEELETLIKGFINSGGRRA